jgi:hypothetical protein
MNIPRRYLLLQVNDFIAGFKAKGLKMIKFVTGKLPVTLFTGSFCQ